MRAYPPIYRIAKDHTEKSIGEAMDNVDVHVLLRQGEVCDLPIFHYPDRPKDAPSQSVHFLIYWRKTSSTWLWQFPVSASTSTAAVQRIQQQLPPGVTRSIAAAYFRANADLTVTIGSSLESRRAHTFPASAFIAPAVDASRRVCR